MARPEDVINIASKEVGYCALDDPEQGTKYGRWMANMISKSRLCEPSSEIWWSMIFVSWVMYQAKVDWDIIPCYSIDAALLEMEEGSNGCFVSFEEAKKGDVVVFNWDEKGLTNHVGIIVENLGDTLETIEGNIADNELGSLREGHYVKRCSRTWDLVLYVMRPPYDDTVTVPSEPVGKLILDGVGGPLTVRKLQEQCGTMPDGFISGQPMNSSQYLGKIWKVEYPNFEEEVTGSQVVAAIQRKIGAEETGIWDAETSYLIQKILIKYGYHLDTEINSQYMGESWVKSLQKSLNENLWTKDFL